MQDTIINYNPCHSMLPAQYGRNITQAWDYTNGEPAFSNLQYMNFSSSDGYAYNMQNRILNTEFQKTYRSPQQTFGNILANDEKTPPPPPIASNVPETLAPLGEEPSTTETVTPEIGEEVETSLAEDLVGDSVAGPIGIALALNTVAGGVASSEFSQQMNQVENQTFQHNVTQPGIAAAMETNLVAQNQQNFIKNVSGNMSSLGNLLGPLGSYLGYAFSGSYTPANMNIAFSSYGERVDPQLSSVVGSGLIEPGQEDQSNIEDASPN